MNMLEHWTAGLVEIIFVFSMSGVLSLKKRREIVIQY